MRIGILAALPGELKPLVKDWKQVKTATSKSRRWLSENGANQWIAVCAGMGADAARRAFAEAESDGALDMVMSVGWAGALCDSVAAGKAYIPGVVIDAQTGERFALKQGETALVTTARVADAKEKQRLAEAYPEAGLVDMEAATVARLAAMRGIPFMCIKGVSDAVDARLPDINPHIDAMGHLRMLTFISAVAFKPRSWPALIHLGRNSARSAETMRGLILEFIKEKNADPIIRTEGV
ncbi:MAG: nucleoside phosphorylase [Acidobacteriaceae bacterium]|nr:nucleoside phosphorylase [Acidobacteriaceae bacterium]